MINSISSAVPFVTQAATTTGGTVATQDGGSSFADVFRSAVSGVDHLQNSADQQVVAMLQGSADADLGKTMISVEKADVAFQLMMQVRNKVVSAYQEMEKMQF